jgi:hypothetical protein
MSIAPWTAGETEEGMKKMYRAHQWANITVNGINWFRPMGDAKSGLSTTTNFPLTHPNGQGPLRPLFIISQSPLRVKTREWDSAVVVGGGATNIHETGHMLLAMTMRSERKESTNVLLCKNVFYIYVYDITYQCDALMRAYLYFFTMTHNQQHYYICMYVFFPLMFFGPFQKFVPKCSLKIKKFWYLLFALKFSYNIFRKLIITIAASPCFTSI